MELLYKSRRLERACTVSREGDREWGPICAAVVRRRLVQLAAARSLDVLDALKPTRLHPLKGDREGQFAVDAKHPFRLVFEPVPPVVAKLADGGIDRTQVTAIRILGVEDYHGR